MLSCQHLWFGRRKIRSTCAMDTFNT